MGVVGHCWDRTYVRVRECYDSLRIIEQCIAQLTGDHKRTHEFDPHEVVPKKIRPKQQDLYVRAENPRGKLGFYSRADSRSDIPFRCKARSSCFVNHSILAELSRGGMITDLVTILGSIDTVSGEVDR